MRSTKIVNDKETIELMIIHERIRQAQSSYNIASCAAIAAFMISIMGTGLLSSNKILEGSATTTGGLFSSMGFIKICKDANDRLDRYYADLNKSKKD
jgi:hypothetical protein